MPEVDDVLVDGLEVLLGLCKCRCSQTFIILDPVALGITCVFLPFIIVRHSEETLALVTLRGLDDRRDELF